MFKCIFFIPILANVYCFGQDFRASNNLLGLIKENSSYCVNFVTKDKIYLRKESIKVEDGFIGLEFNGRDICPLPKLSIDKNGYYVQYNKNNRFNRYEEEEEDEGEENGAACGNCGRALKKGKCTNSQCFFEGIIQ